MTDVLLSIEQSGFSEWIKASDSIFAYPGILLLHTIGMGFVVGINAMIDLRILGVAPGLRLSPMENFLPVLWLGFWVNTISGAILLAIDATHKLTNPDFYIKMIFIALAIINLQMIRNRVFRDPSIDSVSPPAMAKVLAVTSMIFWLGAITSGRLLAYIGPGVK